LSATRTCAGARNELELGGKGKFMADYIIIGGDQKEYGPISAEEVRQWLAEGRAAAQTKAKMEGATEWKMLSDFPEFRDVLKSSIPPLLAASESDVTPKLSGMAITSLVLGILGMFTCALTAPFGLILGIIAVTKVKNSRGALTGFGIALAGLIVSAVALMMIPIFAAMLLPALAAAKQKAQLINCVNNEKDLALAVKVYSGDHANHFPPAATWCDAIATLVGSEKVFKCSAGNASSRCDYGFNAKLDGLDESKINPQTVEIFESDAGWNASGGSELMIGKPRHARMFVVAFADGSVQQLRESQISTLRWDP
jgi:Domain of unknown function (DUF4190)/GYF domain 2